MAIAGAPWQAHGASTALNYALSASASPGGSIRPDFWRVAQTARTGSAAPPERDSSMPPKRSFRQQLPKTLLDVLIQAALIGVLAVYCYRVFRPFLELMLWALILAVMLYPLQRRIANRLGHCEGQTASLIVMVAILILIMPTYLLGTSLIDSAQQVMETVGNGTLRIPPPSVADWPTGRLADWPLIADRRSAVRRLAGGRLCSGLMILGTSIGRYPTARQRAVRSAARTATAAMAMKPGARQTCWIRALPSTRRIGCGAGM
ncbi:hypothetical protein GCM10027514_44960 [Azotobacter armeniacus]